MRYVVEYPAENRIRWFWTKNGALAAARAYTGYTRVVRVRRRSRVIAE